MESASIVVRFMDGETKKEIMSIKTDQIPNIPPNTKIYLHQRTTKNWDVPDVSQTRIVLRTDINISKTYPESNKIFDVRETVDVFIYLTKPK